VVVDPPDDDDELVVVGLHGPQTPMVLPFGMSHVSPGQQSAFTVHAPHACTHDVAPQTKGGVPFGLGTHGRALQQLALDAHAPPAGTHCAGAQRGTPTLSRWQVSSVLQLPLQQSQLALHDVPFSLHTSPSGLQPIGLRHTPIVAPGCLSQVTGWPDPPGKPAEPQQSPSLVQRSPTGWQPLAG
jgi:hypothetical protein